MFLLSLIGPKFPYTKVINLCNVNLYVTADIVSQVIFLDKGSKLCVQVCLQYQKTIQFDGAADISFMKGYCDYIGATDFSSVSESSNKYNLNTTCTCAYKIRCNHRTNVIMYTFQTNCHGFLKVSFTEPNQKHCITRII